MSLNIGSLIHPTCGSDPNRTCCGGTCCPLNATCISTGPPSGQGGACPASAPTICNGSCTNTITDPNNCGACGTVCANRPNVASASCSGGQCVGLVCDLGFGNCDGEAADGCATNTNTDVDNCGGCGIVCPSATAGTCEGTRTCVNGTCGFSPLTESTVCRPAAGECDVAEECDGTSTECPADGFVAAGTICDDDGDQCTDDVCDSAGACTHPPLENGTTCDDGDPCTFDDICTGGACAGTTEPGCVRCDLDPDACADVLVEDDQCQVAVCNQDLGGCEIEDLNDGTECDDGDACTVDDACLAGSCVGESVTCPAATDCIDDVCDGTSTCMEVINVGAGRDDGNLCTETAVCQADGSCLGTPRSCPPPQACEHPGTCAPATGECVYALKQNGTLCRAAADA